MHERTSGWHLVCPSCGRSAPAGHTGIFRVGAWSWLKYVVGFCFGCRRLRLLRLVRET